MNEKLFFDDFVELKIVIKVGLATRPWNFGQWTKYVAQNIPVHMTMWSFREPPPRGHLWSFCGI